MALQATTTQTTEVNLSPALRTKLLKRLKAFHANKQQIDKLGTDQDRLKEEIETLLADAGEWGALVSGIKIDGFSTKLVTPTKSTLDKQKLLALGVTTAMLEEATTTKPGKSYTKVTVPGGKDDE